MADAAAAVNLAEMNSLPKQYYQQSTNQFHAISVSTVDSNLSTEENSQHLQQQHQPLYFNTKNVSSTSTINTSTTGFTNLSTTNRNITVKLYLSAKDVPEPDSRSQANYVVLYYTRDVLDSPSSKSNSKATDQPQHQDVLYVNDDDIHHHPPPSPTALEHIDDEHNEHNEHHNTDRKINNSNNNHDNSLSTRKSRRNQAKRKNKGRQFSILRKYKSSVVETPRAHSPPPIRRSRSNGPHNQRVQSSVASPPDSRTIPLPMAVRSASVPVGNAQRSPHLQDRTVSHIYTSPNQTKTRATSTLLPSPPGSPRTQSIASVYPTNNTNNVSLFTPLIRFIPTSGSVVRAPAHVLKYVAPDTESKVTKNGRQYTRAGWSLIGCTEIARKHGRDIEFSKCFTLSFAPRKNERIVIRACMFDTPCTTKGTDTSRQRLVGVSDFSLASVYSKNGGRVSFPLEFFPISKSDKKKHSKIPQGSFVVVAQRLVSGNAAQREREREGVNDGDIQGMGILKKFRLDVECSKIMRATALSVMMVKKVFYTIHGILENDENSDSWTLLYRSGPSEMIHTKRDGGSMQYNHFSGIRLRAVPGVTLQDDDGSPSSPLNPSSPRKNNSDKENEETQNNNDLITTKSINTVMVSDGQDNNMKKVTSKNGETESGANHLMGMVGKALGVNKKRKFFSLPGADVYVMDDDTRLKMSVWEDNGLSAGYELVADTRFTLKELKSRQLGESSAIKVHANVVGRAILKYVECSSDPRYFCLSLQMQNVQ